MKNKKGAMELSMTTIIIIILGVTLLTLGIMWIKGLGTQLIDTTDSAFGISQDEISRLGLRDQKVYVPQVNKEISIGENEKFTVYVQNFLGVSETFSINIQGNAKDWFQTVQPTEVPSGETFGFPVVVNVPSTGSAAGSIEIVTIRVLKSNGELYGQEAITIEVTE